MPCRFASSGTVAASRNASRAILALNVASNFLRDLVISVLHRLRQSRTLHTLTFGPISGVHFKRPQHPCREFICGWLIASSPLPEWMRPDKSDMIMLAANFFWHGLPVDVVVAAGDRPKRKPEALA